MNYRDSQDLKRTKAILKQAYPLIMSTYKIMSINSFSEIFSVSGNTFHDFLVTAKVLDENYVPSDLGVMWSATVMCKGKKQKYNPNNALVRFEFLEILVRIAHDKYKNQYSTISGAVEKLMTLLTP